MTGSIEIRGQKIFVMRKARFLSTDGQKSPLNMDTLKPGQVVGVYVDHQAKAQFDVNIARFVVPDPPPEPPRKASMTLDALAPEPRRRDLSCSPW